MKTKIIKEIVKVLITVISTYFGVQAMEGCVACGDGAVATPFSVSNK